ncbi:MAG TPA: triose-phosphate isomerase [Thermomicrobiales bacterium]|nr:triose-phosphate isomerase [Thermomicrobiales bacterium]
MTRPFLFGTNFKMNQTPAESAAFYERLAASVTMPSGVHLFVIPAYTSLAAVAEVAGGEPHEIWVGAQNVHWAPEGAYTGEISVPMLLALGVDLVLLGHAERRRYFHEADVELNRKMLAALAGGLRVLLAIGETAEERGFGVSGETVLRQLKIGLHGVQPDQLDRLQIAYEPVWSIGADGTPALPEDVAPIAATIRAALGELFAAPGHQIPILYGGSVDPANAGSFTALPDIDGLFVGRAAWTVDGFLATYRAGLAGKRR